MEAPAAPSWRDIPSTPLAPCGLASYSAAADDATHKREHSQSVHNISASRFPPRSDSTGTFADESPKQLPEEISHRLEVTMRAPPDTAKDLSAAGRPELRTGRISRALKGQPLHKCNECDKVWAETVSSARTREDAMTDYVEVYTRHERLI